MAASAYDAHPYPIYAARYRETIALTEADGDLVPGATGLDTEVSLDAGTAADATNEATQIATSTGLYYVDFTATEMTSKTTAVLVKTSTVDAKTTPFVLRPVRLPIVRTGTAQAGAASTITLDSGASAIDGYYIGAYVNITNNTPTNALGQARMITGYVGSTKVATIEGAWGTNPSSSSTFEILATERWVYRFGDVRAFNALAGVFASGRPEVNTSHVSGTTQTARDLGAALPAATPGAAGGVVIAGSNAATTFATLTSTGAFSIGGVSNVAQTGDSFARIGAAGAGLTAVVLPSGGLANVTAWTVAITGSLSGSVGSVTGSVGSLTGYTAPNNAGITSIINTLGTGGNGLTAIGDTRLACLDTTISSRAAGGTINSLDALNTALSNAHGPGSWEGGEGGGGNTAEEIRAALGMAAANLDTQLAAILAAIPSAAANAAGLLDSADAIEAGLTVRKALRGLAAVLLGVTSNDGLTIKGAGVATTRISATLSGDLKDRTAVDLTLG